MLLTDARALCLRCGHTWTKTYPEDMYEKWRNVFLEPDFVRDYTLLYLRTVQQMDIPDPLTLDWTCGRETPEEIVGYETYVYKAGGIVVTVSYPVVLPENTAYKIKVEVGDLTIWEGGLHRREFEYLENRTVNELDINFLAKLRSTSAIVLKFI